MNNTTTFRKGLSLVVFLLIWACQDAYAQTNFFRALPAEEKMQKMRSVPTQNISKLIVVELNESSLKSFLNSVPYVKNSNSSQISLDIPMPDGAVETFRVSPSSILSVEQQALHPEIRTYKGQGIMHSGYKITFTYTPIGFSAIITGVNGDTVMIDKVKNIQGNLYRIYFSKDVIFPESMHSGNRCKTISHRQSELTLNNGNSARFTNGSQIKTFRIAIAATGEFTASQGGQSNAYSKIVQYVAELNAIYGTEMGINLTLVSGTNLVYTNPSTDPYTNNNQGSMLTENRNNLNAIIGNSNYDLGHVFGTELGSGGGVAYFQSVCNDNYKGGGVSGIGDEAGYAHIFNTQLVAHEVGHQFGMSHSYNSNIPVCTTREYSTSVEPGSGATIMSYGFTCSNNSPSDGVTGDDDYHHNTSGGLLIGPFLNFHIKSIQQSLGYLTTINCNTSISSGNSLPVIAAMPTTYTIPKSTPFQLKGLATDADGDALSYSWEGTNISSMPAIPDPDDPNRMISPPELDGTVLENTSLPPFFRSYPPISSGIEPGLRYYPLLSAILDGSNYAKGDKLPSVAYTTTHTLSVRDGQGGIATEDVIVNVDNTGPFLITNDPTGAHNGNTSMNITWSVNGTTATPVSCKLVDIWLSVDGGHTFTTQLATAVPNIGTASVTLPNISTIQARIKVMPSASSASGNIPNIFFDISNNDFIITPSANASFCIGGCNNNTFINSTNPNTLEYDNMVGVYHSTLAKKEDGKLFTWGFRANANGTTDVLSPIEVSPVNGYNYTGDILKFTAGEDAQFAVLTSTGLYIWGVTANLVSTAIKNSNVFSAVSIGTYGITGTKADGLPDGVSPSDVKMLFGSYGTLGLVTCNGQAWILSFNGNKNGDGTAQGSGTNNNVWHRVRKSATSTDYLTDVVAMRGNAQTMMALTSAGKLYTWGTDTYLGESSNPMARTYATEMLVPSGITPKMIGMTIYQGRSTYYVLSTLGELYSLGRNNVRQLGDFTTTDRTSWVRVKKSSTENMDNINWFSPQEHHQSYPAVSTITSAGKMYSWGYNAGNMFTGGTANTSYNPLYMSGGLDPNDKLLAVETGGHTTMVFKQCTLRYGYIGHRINGSMGDGTATSAYETSYNFTNTANFAICGAPTAPPVQNLKMCPGRTVDLANAHTGIIPQGETLQWWTTPTMVAGTQVTTPATAGPGTYYAFYIGTCATPPASQPVIISYYTLGEAGSENCHCIKPGATGTPESYTKVGILTKASITNSSGNIKWPENVPNGHIVMDSAMKGFVITHMTTSQRDALIPVNGMLIYNIDLKCVQLYRGTSPGVDPSRKGWNCIERGCNE